MNGETLGMNVNLYFIVDLGKVKLNTRSSYLLYCFWRIFLFFSSLLVHGICSVLMVTVQLSSCGLISARPLSWQQNHLTDSWGDSSSNNTQTNTIINSLFLQQDDSHRLCGRNGEISIVTLLPSGGQVKHLSLEAAYASWCFAAPQGTWNQIADGWMKSSHLHASWTPFSFSESLCCAGRQCGDKYVKAWWVH